MSDLLPVSGATPESVRSPAPPAIGGARLCHLAPDCSPLLALPVLLAEKLRSRQLAARRKFQWSAKATSPSIFRCNQAREALFFPVLARTRQRQTQTQIRFDSIWLVCDYVLAKVCRLRVRLQCRRLLCASCECVLMFPLW